SLFRKEPLATAHTTGSSRLATTPLTCCAFRAMSSPSTPAVFLLAALVSSATSSSTLAISSSKASRLAPAMAPSGLLARPHDNAAGPDRHDVVHLVLAWRVTRGRAEQSVFVEQFVPNVRVGRQAAPDGGGNRSPQLAAQARPLAYLDVQPHDGAHFV